MFRLNTASIMRIEFQLRVSEVKVRVDVDKGVRDVSFRATHFKFGIHIRAVQPAVFFCVL